MKMNEPLPSESTLAADPLTTLEQHGAFIARHIGTTPADHCQADLPSTNTP